MLYKALFEDECQMAIYEAESHEEAIQEGFSYEEEYGTLFNVILIDEDCNELETVF